MVGYIRKVLKNSSVDGPGNRMVIFLQGCQFNCIYCHNPETIPVIKSDKEGTLKIMTPSDLVAEVVTYRDYISGVTISGGECTVQFDFLETICQKLHENKIHVLIDTNGDLSEINLKKIMPWVDGFMLDIKAVDPIDHKKLTGKSNEQVLKNFELMLEANLLFEVRTVIIPDESNSAHTVLWVSQKLAEKAPYTRYKLIAFRKHGIDKSKTDASSPTLEQMNYYKNIVTKAGLKNIIVL